MPRSIAVSALLLLALAPSGVAGWSDRVVVARPAEKTIADWPRRAERAARRTMERYGRPDEVREDAVIWHGNGPWKRTTVHRRARGAFDRDFIENALAYEVPDRALEDLALFDKGLAVDAALSELSSRAEDESLNYLALNLADEIINGKRTVADALAYRGRILRLSESGKSSPYLKGLLFAANAGSPLNRWTVR